MHVYIVHSSAKKFKLESLRRQACFRQNTEDGKRKERKMKRITAIILSFVMLFAFAACGDTKAGDTDNKVPETNQGKSGQPGGNSADNNKDGLNVESIDLMNLSEDMLKIAGGASGGMYYTLSTAVAQLIESNTNIRLQVEATEGGSANVSQVSGNPLIIGMTSTPLVYEGAHQTGWAKDATAPVDGIAALFPCYPSAFGCYALASSGIETIDDLDGKTVCLGPAGSSYDWQLKIYDACGISINPVSLAWSDAVSSLKDGTIDACSFSGAHPFASCTEIQLTNEVNFIQIPDEVLEKLLENDPTRPIVTIDAGTYTYMTEDYRTLCEYSFFMCNEDLPEDAAYAITKLAIENSEILNLAVAAAKDITPDKLDNITTAKLHPGAYRYYQEIGVDVPETMIP